MGSLSLGRPKWGGSTWAKRAQEGRAPGGASRKLPPPPHLKTMMLVTVVASIVYLTHKVLMQLCVTLGRARNLIPARCSG